MLTLGLGVLSDTSVHACIVVSDNALFHTHLAFPLILRREVCARYDSWYSYMVALSAPISGTHSSLQLHC